MQQPADVMGLGQRVNDWLAELVGWLWLVLVGRLVGWLVGRLVGWLVGRSVGWLVG